MANELEQKLRNAVHVQCSRQGADYAKVERLLLAGADPALPLSAKQVSIMEEVCNPRSPTGYASANRAALLALFVKHGANPMVFSGHMRQLLRTNLYSSTVRGMLQAINEQVVSLNSPAEKYQDAKGRNLLAVLSQDTDSWETLKAILEGKSSAMWKLPCVLAWHHDVDGEGKNLANLVIERALRSVKIPPHLWEVLDVIVERGIDLHRPDHAGITAAGLLVSILDREDIGTDVKQSLKPFMEHLATAQRAMLNQSTAIVSLSRPARRV